MFVGHYAVGFIAKKKFEDIPLWLLFIAVQFVDILAFIFVLLGIERIKYNPTSNPFLRTILDFVPFTHSLTSSLIISLAVFLVFWKLKNKVWASVLSICVLSHWFIDLLVHTPEMPILWNSFKVGLGLWHFPWTAFLIEIGLFVGAGYYLLKNKKSTWRLIFLIAFAIILYTPSMFAPEQEVPVPVVSIISLSLYSVFAALAYWSEK